MVGRPREFDPDEVLEAAMRAFWANGYESTSLSDLVAATGLHKGSLYQSFGDKHSLFLQSLNRYLDEVRECKKEALANAESPLSGIRDVLHGFIDKSGDGDCPHGCLAVKTLVEMAPHDPEVKLIMDKHKQDMQGSMQAQLEEAQRNGELAADKSPEMITILLMVFMDGLATWGNSGASAEEGHALLTAQLDALF
ncbi:MAG: TetR/AcrR family transcriptional regulator [Gammaproteobacteria bacterium]|nr:TetR/AcrR family transcriptional regulator [Gammaproteobacteria bacterium]